MSIHQDGQSTDNDSKMTIAAFEVYPEELGNDNKQWFGSHL